MKAGNKLFYDYYTATDTSRNFRYIEVANSLKEVDPTNIGGSFEIVSDIYIKYLVIKSDGLYGLACEDCGMGILTCLTKFEFLYAPSVPHSNQEIPLYSCGRSPYKENKIIETNRTVTVPKGTFNTYVILHKNYGKSYWDPEKGLIMYDKYDINGNFIGSLKLSRIVR